MMGLETTRNLSEKTAFIITHQSGNADLQPLDKAKAFEFTLLMTQRGIWVFWSYKNLNNVIIKTLTTFIPFLSNENLFLNRKKTSCFTHIKS